MSATCSTCGTLGDREYGAQKNGWPEHDTFLPAAARQLVCVRELKHGGSRASEVWRCPACGSWFHYTTDYEYLAGGSEDEQLLVRITAEQADALR